MLVLGAAQSPGVETSTQVGSVGGGGGPGAGPPTTTSGAPPALMSQVFGANAPPIAVLQVTAPAAKPSNGAGPSNATTGSAAVLMIALPHVIGGWAWHTSVVQIAPAPAQPTAPGLVHTAPTLVLGGA